MSQTRRGSLIEATANIIAGFTINYFANFFILPRYGFTTLGWASNFQIGIWYTVVSVIRQFVLRRVFNAIKRKWNHEPETQITFDTLIIEQPDGTAIQHRGNVGGEGKQIRSIFPTRGADSGLEIGDDESAKVPGPRTGSEGGT